MENIRTTTSQNEIVIRDLVKAFDEVTAVNNLNLEVHKGKMFGFLGPNGAGKTTTISILCGLQTPSAGTAYIGGLYIRRNLSKIKDR